MVNYIYKLMNSRAFRAFKLALCFALPLFLSACGDDDIDAGSNDANYGAQAACWHSHVFDFTLKYLNLLFKNSSSLVADGGASVIILGFSVWLAWRILPILGSFKEENLGEILTEIGQKLFVCAFCAYVVANSAHMIEAVNLFVISIYNTMLELGAEVLGQHRSEMSLNLGSFIGEVTFTQTFNDNSCHTTVKAENLESIKGMATCLSCAISDRLNTGIKVALQLIGTLEIGAILTGIIVILMFTAAKLCFILYTLDALFRVNFAAYFMPLLVMGIPFKFTRKWSKHCFLMFINSAGCLMFLALLVTLGSAALESVFTTLGSGDGVFTANLSGPVLIAIVLISFLMLSIPGLAIALANKFIGGGNSDVIQKAITQFVVNTVKKLATKALGKLTQSASEVITDQMDKYQYTKEVKDSYKKLSNILESMAGGQPK